MQPASTPVLAGDLFYGPDFYSPDLEEVFPGKRQFHKAGATLYA